MAHCTACGAALNEGAKFCGVCGAPAVAAPASAEPVQPGPDAKTSKLAIAGFVLALLPVCLNLIGGVLGIVALTRIKQNPRELKGRGLAIAAMVLAGIWTVMIPFIGILAAIAIPNFIKYQARAKQAEAPAMLKVVHADIQSFVMENGEDAQPESLDDIGFEPLSKRRYAYFALGDEVQPDIGGPYELPRDLAEELAAGTVEAAAVGNVDEDAALDLWTVGQNGAPEHRLDDLLNE